MEKLTTKEEEIMQILWEIDKGFVKDIIEKLPLPKPAYTTISSIVRILETKGFVDHTAYGTTHQYFPLVAKDEYKKLTFQFILKNYFDNSIKNVVSYLAKEEKLSNEEIMEISEIIKAGRKKK